MKLSVSGLKVLITASASGIGLAVAQAFLNAGAAVHVCDVSVVDGLWGALGSENLRESIRPSAQALS